MNQNDMDFGGVSFGDPPQTVQANMDEMSAIMRQRRHGNEQVMRKNDTERYLVIVYTDRAERENALRVMGLPHDERYLAGGAVELRLRDGAALLDAVVLTARDVKAADVEHSGAAG